ncbi:hypothetical protein CEXT_136421 [Caerostris extrusa]|uniref:Uncharacterized protein n=1 Tax=Caerostris extrusa TaxID=172846 RepID=A0AAV4U2D6_CAEEX|nr:hypothetical protein CEXT_136421 [Caerostris extrusa]
MKLKPLLLPESDLSVTTDNVNERGWCAESIRNEEKNLVESANIYPQQLDSLGEVGAFGITRNTIVTTNNVKAGVLDPSASNLTRESERVAVKPEDNVTHCHSCRASLDTQGFLITVQKIDVVSLNIILASVNTRQLVPRHVVAARVSLQPIIFYLFLMNSE